MMVAGVTEQWSTLCVDHSTRNKNQKLVGHFYEDRIFYRLQIFCPIENVQKIWPTKTDFGQLNAKICQKMANGQLLLLVLGSPTGLPSSYSREVCVWSSVQTLF